MPYSAVKVANELLRLAREDNPPRALTPLQLLKLVYIAHGWSFIHLASPLINEQPQAWLYGPVIPSLYHSVKQYGGNPVTGDIPGDFDPQELSVDSKELIRAVYTAYGHLSGPQLSNMTHLPGTPWHEAWHHDGRNALIPNDAISQHYKQLAQSRGVNGH